MDLLKKFLQKNFIFILLISILVSTSPTHAASKDKSSLLSMQENQAVKNLVVLDSSISSYKQKTNDLDKKITSLEKDLRKVDSKINKEGNKLTHKKLLFNKRIQSMYKEGNVSFIEVILKSKNINEVINKLGIFNLIADNDSRLIKRIAKDQKKLDDLKSSLNKKIINLKELKAENKAAYTKLLFKEKSQKQYINDLKSKKARVDAISNQVKTVINKMDSLGKSKLPRGRKIRVLATGYAANNPADGTNGTTSTGIPAARGIAAVSANPSRRVLPLGTKIYVPGYGKALIADVGGGVGSNQIDLCFKTHGEGNQWGVRWVTITVYD